MRKIIVFAIAALGSLFINTGFAATITAVANGPWSTNATWSCNCQPTNADNVIIPVGRTVSITAGPVILTGGPVITITINGTLSLNSGGTLIVDASDIVKVNAGGKITGTGILCAVWSGGTPIFVPNGTSINGPSTITSGSLPITLLFFEGHVVSHEVLLLWASASEKNFDFYALQRSTDGKNFETIAEVRGAGNSTNRHDYSFSDTDPVAGVSYYRLKSVDLDGTSETFTMIRIDLEPEKRSVRFFPNPVTGHDLNAKLNFHPKGGGQIALYDLQGSLLLESPLDASEHYTLQLPPSIGQGIYFVVLKTDEAIYRDTIVVH